MIWATAPLFEAHDDGLSGRPATAFAGARSDEKIDRIKPDLQRRPRVLKDRACCGIGVIPASGAGKCATVSHAVEHAFNTAGPAHMPLAKADIKDVLQAGFIIRRPLKEFADAEIGSG